MLTARHCLKRYRADMAMCLQRPEGDDIADWRRGVRLIRRLVGMAIAAVVVMSSVPVARAADVDAVASASAAAHER